MTNKNTIIGCSSARRQSSRLKAMEVVKKEEVSEETEAEEAASEVEIDKKSTRKRKSRSGGSSTKKSSVKLKAEAASEPIVKLENDDEESDARFIGEPVSAEEARKRWPKKYEAKKPASKSRIQDIDEDVFVLARRHYLKAEVDGHVFELYDDAHVKAGEGQADYICNIIEMFEGVDGALYFTAQWYYRAKDTVIEYHGDGLIDRRRVFLSKVQNDNPLDCLVKKINIARIPLQIGSHPVVIPEPFDYYCDMMYLLPYSTYIKLPPGGTPPRSTVSNEDGLNASKEASSEDEMSESKVTLRENEELTLLDLYSGCGAMSTGLCFGANMGGSNLVTKWAVDINEFACESLKLNHSETKVRNESAEDFLSLLKEWKKLCITFSLIESECPNKELEYFDMLVGQEEEDEENDDEDEEGEANDDSDDANDPSRDFEVKRLLEIYYGDLSLKTSKKKSKRKCGEKSREKSGEKELYFKVRWRGYSPKYDSWEPLSGLRDCRKRIKEFVIRGYKSKILPLPGHADVICGGPPCQGLSGHNRFRNEDEPLEDEKNKQLLVFMEIVEFLRPRFVLMENVVDMLKFSKGYVGRYALGRLIQMNYQTRLGIMAAGAYGLAQFRMRVFFWGALSSEILPQYPLPTHDLVLKGFAPKEFERNTVAYNEGQLKDLKTRLLLRDAIFDLPAVGNYEGRDVMPYDKEPETDFQRFIRLNKRELLAGASEPGAEEHLLYDHRPLEMNADDYQRTIRIPKRKGACFRDLPGVRVRPDNRVEWDPNVERVYLDSQKPLVPDYAMTFRDGSSTKPFARRWWDETVPTVVTRAQPHNQAILHPEQDRVLTIRENARLQGFPDYYQLCGPVVERYIQVGNAVAVPVARALGYALHLAMKGIASEDPLFVLPKNFPQIRNPTPVTEAEAVA